MDIRALPVSQGVVWFKQAIDLGARNPRAVFGAALLLIIAMYTTVLAVALLAAVIGGAGDAAGQPDMRRAAMVAARCAPAMSSRHWRMRRDAGWPCWG